MARCELCGEAIESYELLQHLRVMHPDIEIELEFWPDGGPVVHDAMDDL